MRRLCAIFGVLLALAGALTASAMTAVFTCEVPELYMELDFPLDWYVLTRDAEEDNPGLYFYDDSLDQMLASFETQDIYLDALNLDSMRELTIIMLPGETDVFDLGLCDEETFDMLSSEWEANPVWTGGNDVQCFRAGELWQSGARFATFNRLELQDDIELRCFQMSTVHNGQTIHMILTDYSGHLGFTSGSLDQAMYDIASTLHFTEVLTPPDGQADVVWVEESVTDSVGVLADGFISVIGGLMPFIVLIAILVSARASKRRRAAQGGTPMRRPQARPRPATPAEKSRRKQAPPDPGRPDPPRPDTRPKHNCSEEEQTAVHYAPVRSNETVFCLDCGKKVSLRHPKCPHCGARVV